MTLIKKPFASLFLIIFCIAAPNGMSASPHKCEETVKAMGVEYWFYEAGKETDVVDDTPAERTWIIVSNPKKCYLTPQSEINQPTVHFLGYVKAIEKWGRNLTPENREKIEAVLDADISSVNDFPSWLGANRKSLFWSYERNKLVLLEGGFSCRTMNEASGKEYWNKQAQGQVENMDTSATQRLWRDAADRSRCYITPLKEINDEGVRSH